ncbi:MAG: beta-ketoacyl-ACP synthase II [Deltaproteobacteria bacterium]|nr:beta-ketoacyl-ACP synthase II [Deltaproteobacteria bacterium]
MGRRVVITGTGLVTPLGIGNHANWSNLIEGKSGVGKTQGFDVTDFASQISAEVRDFDPLDYIDPKGLKQMDRFTQFGVVASLEALKESGLEITDKNAFRVGTLVGTGIGGLPEFEYTHSRYLEKGPRRISPFFIPKMIANLASGQVSMLTGAKGPNLCVVTACTTGTHSIGEAMHIIKRDDADVMIAGGTEGSITPISVGGFGSMKALSTRNDEPTKASRPFDKERDGFVIGEGAGVVILEELEHAKARGANIIAEVIGYGLSSDAHHISAPAPDGIGAASCMRHALRNAKINPEQVDYINAHGTSTPLNDKFETMGIKTVFGEHAKKLKISSTKSMTGHLLGGAGGVETVYCAMMLQHQKIAPTINLENPDPECDLDYVPNVAIDHPVNIALSNSFGFGGTNGTLILQRYA